MRRLLPLPALALLAVVAAAWAAGPVKGGHYSGQTTQRILGHTVHTTLSFRVSANGTRVLGFTDGGALPPSTRKCGAGQGVGGPGLGSATFGPMRIRHGAFSGRAKVRFNGKVVRVDTVSGHFLKHRRAAGKLTTRFPSNHTSCASETAPWAARA